MRILVTGGLGAVGRPIVQCLQTNGHTVRVLDRQSEPGITGIEYSTGDVTDFNTVREAVRGTQAVVHLAALTHPAAGPGQEIFRINCTGTYNVYEAAAQEGIRRVVCASSINALGYNFGIKSFPIQYLPVDEAHPGFTTDAYSFSKQVTESIAAYYWRREGISGVQLRLPWVYHMGEEFRAMVQQFLPIIPQAYEKVMAMPADEQVARARQVVAQQMEMRASRAFERPWEDEPPQDDWPPDLSDPLPLISFGYNDFWAVIHDENSALAFERGVLAEYEGSHPLYVADAQNIFQLDAETLARIFFPETPARSRPLVGDEPLVSFDQARRLIGYEPETSMTSLL